MPQEGLQPLFRRQPPVGRNQRPTGLLGKLRFHDFILAGTWSQASFCGSRRIMALHNGIKPLIVPFMSATVTIDAAGRVVIPKSVRDTLHLEAGDTLSLESDGESVTLRSLRPGSPLKKGRGIWVFRSGRKLLGEETNRTLEDVRNERQRRVRGSGA